MKRLVGEILEIHQHPRMGRSIKTALIRDSICRILVNRVVGPPTFDEKATRLCQILNLPERSFETPADFCNFILAELMDPLPCQENNHCNHQSIGCEWYQAESSQ